jgi:hypothetical protein
MNKRGTGAALLVLLLWAATLVFAGDYLPSEFSNMGSIANTRHNLTQRQPGGGGPDGSKMDDYRNNYGEVCVYCHTPHAANASVTAPLWNRSIKATTYTTYDKLNTSTLTQTVSQPGAASLMCLSCHDGQQAIDAIINMPGSGKVAQGATSNLQFLNSWDGQPRDHDALTSAGATGCLACHQPGIRAAADNFTAAALGTDLRDDHPVGVTFPTAVGNGTDWKAPNGNITRGQRVSKFFDENSNSRPDKNEIRMYDSGLGAMVECGSCHDPHGVPSDGAGSKFNPTFLRKSNTASAVCLTCHNK